jgi:hypothetical protein
MTEDPMNESGFKLLLLSLGYFEMQAGIIEGLLARISPESGGGGGT